MNMEFLEESWMKDWFDPLDLLDILGYPNQLLELGWGLTHPIVP